MKEIIFLIQALLWLWSTDPGPGATPQWDSLYPIGSYGTANKKDIAAHDYHGIGHSVEDETGFWFERDGKRCKLYTNGFMARWKNG